MPVLTMVDILGIQNFVFTSNRLRNVDAGSTIVHQVSTLDFEGDKNGAWANHYQNNVLLKAGGNLVLRFETRDQAKIFVSEYTNHLLRFAPGLQVVTVHLEYEKGELARKVREILKTIQRCKAGRLPGIPLLNLGVAETCFETGLAAVDFDKHEKSYPIARGVVARNNMDKTRSRWRSYLPETLSLGGKEIRPRFPFDIDRLGRTPGDTSMIGIIHVDGNSMGRKINDWLENCIEENMTDEDFADAYSALCKGIDYVVNNVTKNILDRVLGSITFDNDKYVLHGRHSEFGLYAEEGFLDLPIRPVVASGDELTFICDGRIALDLASFAVCEYGKHEVPGLGRVAACAGVHVVPSRAPIIRAYHLAESLCASAKQRVRALMEEGEQPAGFESALDWHIGYTGTVENLERLRSRQYRRDSNLLTLRPYVMGDAEICLPGTWHWLVRDVLTGEKGFQSSLWQEHRNKAKELRETIRLGPEMVVDEVRSWKIPFPHLCLPPGLPQNGYLNAAPGVKDPATPLLDAVELMDLSIFLDTD